MKRIITLLSLCFMGGVAVAQEPILDEWILNTTEKTASYWENIAVGQGATANFEYNTTTILADILSVCYNDESIWVESEGMTNDMGKFTNPGTPDAQGYSFQFARNPVKGSGTEEVPESAIIGVLLNGIPIYGLGDGKSYAASSGSTSPMGDGLWVGEAYFTEGETLDTAFAAHPQQQGAYHSHATPFRLYEDPISEHSPIVGYSNDGFPVYGPFGYSTADNNSSGVTRMTSSYDLRNITTRTILQDGTTSNPTGPNVTTNGDYDIGAFIQDYEYIDGSGTLDEHNGRFCVTPEYPDGTYAYFVTVDAAGTPIFPYYIGTTYYGTPVDENNLGEAVIPSTGTECVSLVSGIRASDFVEQELILNPNPATKNINLTLPSQATGSFDVRIINSMGELVYSENMMNSNNLFNLNIENLENGVYMVRVIGSNQLYTSKFSKN
jgi:hypothetical protein